MSPLVPVSPFCVETMTSQEAADHRIKQPLLIVPVGATEVWGQGATLGCANLCSAALAHKVSAQTQILVAPTLTLGYSLPYGMFDGTCAIRKETMERVVRDLLRCFSTQGFRGILLVNTTIDNEDPIRSAIAFMRKLPISVRLVTWPLIPEVGSAIESTIGERDSGRYEFSILSLISYLDERFLRQAKCRSNATIDPASFDRWRKRGKDPHKFRKLFSSGSVPLMDRVPDPVVGKAIYSLATNVIVKMARLTLTETAQIATSHA